MCHHFHYTDIILRKKHENNPKINQNQPIKIIFITHSCFIPLIISNLSVMKINSYLINFTSHLLTMIIVLFNVVSCNATNTSTYYHFKNFIRQPLFTLSNVNKKTLSPVDVPHNFCYNAGDVKEQFPYRKIHRINNYMLYNSERTTILSL